MYFGSAARFGIAVFFEADLTAKTCKAKKKLFKKLPVIICEMVLRCVDDGKFFNYVHCHSSIGLN